MTIEKTGPENLLRAIFRDKPPDVPIYSNFTNSDGTTVSLKDALNIALDTLRPTRGKNDSGPWPRRKTVLDKCYGLNGEKLTLAVIAVKCRIAPRSVYSIKRETLRELRRDEKVTRLLSVFFVPISIATIIDPMQVR